MAVCRGLSQESRSLCIWAIMIGPSRTMIALVLTVASNSHFPSNVLCGFKFLMLNFEVIINGHTAVRNNRVGSVSPMATAAGSVLNVVTLTDDSHGVCLMSSPQSFILSHLCSLQSLSQSAIYSNNLNLPVLGPGPQHKLTFWTSVEAWE